MSGIAAGTELLRWDSVVEQSQGTQFNHPCESAGYAVSVRTFFAQAEPEDWSFRHPATELNAGKGLANGTDFIVKDLASK